MSFSIFVLNMIKNLDLTIVICAYKATSALKLCLHQLARYAFKNKDLLIYENSPVDYTLNREFLNQYGISYINNPGGSHADTLNRALLTDIKTKYALILDSDCFCINDPRFYVDYAMRHNIQLYGEICGDRGGYHIHHRVQPWYCIVDVNFIKTHNIQFVDFERIKQTHSESFVKKELLASARNKNGYYYDAGSSMFEDVINNDGICADLGDKLPYVHLEGASWRCDTKEYKLIYDEQKQWLNMLKKKFLYDEKYFQEFSK